VSIALADSNYRHLDFLFSIMSGRIKTWEEQQQSQQRRTLLRDKILRRRAFDSPSGSSTKETVASFDERLGEKLFARPDYKADVSQSSWEWDIETRTDMWVEGKMIGREEEEDEDAVDQSYDIEEQRFDIGVDRSPSRSSSLEQDSDDSDDDGDKENHLSASTIDANYDDGLINESNQGTLSSVWQELAAISARLQRERRKLRLWNEQLQSREDTLVAAEADLDAVVDKEIQRRLRNDNDECDIVKWKRKAEEETRNYKRVKASFDQLRTVHEELRDKNRELESTNIKWEKQNLRLKTRLAQFEATHAASKAKHNPDLAKIGQNQYSAKLDLGDPPPRQRSQSAKETAKNTQPSSSSSSSLQTQKAFLDLVVSLLDWLTVSHLEQSPPMVIKKTENAQLKAKAYASKINCQDVQERCNRILPYLVLVMPIVAKNAVANALKVQLPVLRFLHWSFMHMDDGKKCNKASPPIASMRHLAKILYAPKVVRLDSSRGLESSLEFVQNVSENSSVCLDIFYQSRNQHIRFLSCLLLLKTLTQPDILSKVLDTIKADLKDESVKEYFVAYCATPILMQFLRPTHKQGLLTPATDILVSLAFDSLSLTAFLQSCSYEAFFRQISALLRTSNLSPSVLEKISTILMKLSKLHSNRRFFDAFAFALLLSRLLGECGPEHAFLTLNLKSTLLNITGPIDSSPADCAPKKLKPKHTLHKKESGSTCSSTLSLQSDVESVQELDGATGS